MTVVTASAGASSAGITGGNAPVSLFMGDVQKEDEAEKRLEDYLPDTGTPASIDPNSRLYCLLHSGRAGQSDFDLKNSPLTLFIYTSIGDEKAQAGLANAQAAAAAPAQAAAPPQVRVFTGDVGLMFNVIKPDKTADFEMIVAKLKEAQAAGLEIFAFDIIPELLGFPVQRLEPEASLSFHDDSAGSCSGCMGIDCLRRRRWRAAGHLRNETNGNYDQSTKGHRRKG